MLKHLMPAIAGLGCIRQKIFIKKIRIKNFFVVAFPIRIFTPVVEPLSKNIIQQATGFFILIFKTSKTCFPTRLYSNFKSWQQQQKPATKVTTTIVNKKNGRKICVLKLSDTCLKLLFEIGQTTMSRHRTNKKTKILTEFVCENKYKLIKFPFL